MGVEPDPSEIELVAGGLAFRTVPRTFFPRPRVMVGGVLSWGLWARGPFPDLPYTYIDPILLRLLHTALPFFSRERRSSRAALRLQCACTSPTGPRDAYMYVRRLAEGLDE